MSRTPTLPAHPWSRRGPRAAGAASLAAALLAALSACKDIDTVPVGATHGGAALAASQPTVDSAQVLPPPMIQQVSTPATKAPPATGELASVDAQLDKTLGSAASCTADTECHSVSVGGRACGGPTGYRAYSDKTVSTATVEALAQHERELAAQAAKESHQVSPCFMLADPGAHCEQSKCVTGPASS